MTFHPSGIFVPLITPFAESGEIATTELERLAHDVLEAGAAGLVALGTTGEPATLSPREHREIVRICGKVCRDHGVPLVIGAGSNDTLGTVQAVAELSGEADAAAALVVVPYYTRPSEEGVVAHFEYVADRSPLPLILYNVPYRTGRSLGADTVVRLAEHPRIVGVKQAVGVVDVDTAQVLSQCIDPSEFAVLAGEDALVSPLLAMGASGAILATANVCAREFAELFQLWGDGQLAEACAQGNRLVGPVTALMGGPNPTVIKAVLHAQGRISTPAVRLPLLPARDSSAAVRMIRAL